MSATNQTGHPTQGTAGAIYSEEYFAQSNNATSQSGGRNLTITRTAVGRWTAVLNTPHPDNIDYHITATAEEQSGNRDTPDITVVQASKTANGFSIQITTGDNGAAADGYVDTPFSIGICAPVNVIIS